jgi:hypothetical protein
LTCQAQELELYPQFAMSSSTREDALERSKNQSSTVRNFLKVHHSFSLSLSLHLYISL